MKLLSFSAILLIIYVSCNKNKNIAENVENAVVAEDSSDKQYIVNSQKKIDSSSTKHIKINQIEFIISSAISISNEIYKSLLIQNYTAPNKFIHPDVFEVSTPADFTKSYQNAQIKMGKLAFVKLVDKGAKCNTDGENGKGDYCELIFDAQYKDGTLREKFIFFRKDSTHVLKLLGYQYHQFEDYITLTEKLRIK